MNPDELTFVAGATCLGASVAIPLLTRSWRASLAIQIVGLVLLGCCGVAITLGARAFGSGFHSGYAPAFGIDRLSAFFLVLVAAVGVPSLAHAREDLHAGAGARAISGLTGCFCLTLCGLLAARDVTTFLAFWESMTLVPAVAILVGRRDAGARRDVFTYLAVTHIGGVCVWIALIALSAHGALGGAAIQGSGLRALIAVLAIIGFGTKAGLVPLHSWLPRAHPLAPPHLSALMSGVMVKLALYGMIRVLFQWDAPVPSWAALLLLGMGAASALIGITLAAFQRELKRLLAFCTVENVGVVTLALAASLLLAATGHPVWASVAFAAAMLQSLVHALAKGTMFLACGSLASRLGKLDLDRIGGLATRMPWTSAAIVMAAMSLAGLPPLGGFASEWLTLQALIHLAFGDTSHARGVGVAGTFAAVALVMAAAVAVLTFAAVIGVSLLGQPRTPLAAQATETGHVRRLALLIPAGVCLLAGSAPGLLLPVLSRLRPGAAGVSFHTGAGLALPGTGSLPAIGVTVTLLLLVTALWLLRGAGQGARRARRTAATPVWVCGQPLTPALAWSPAGFVETLRLMSQGTASRLLDLRVLEPVSEHALRAAARVRRLQSGSLTAYLGYLLTLLVVALALFRLGLLG